MCSMWRCARATAGVSVHEFRIDGGSEKRRLCSAWRDMMRVIDCGRVVSCFVSSGDACILKSVRWIAGIVLALHVPHTSPLLWRCAYFALHSLFLLPFNVVEQMQEHELVLELIWVELSQMRATLP